MGNYDTPPSYRRNNAIRSHSRNHDFFGCNAGSSKHRTFVAKTQEFSRHRSPFRTKVGTHPLFCRNDVSGRKTSHSCPTGVMPDYSYHRKHTRDPTIFPDRDHEKVPDVLRQPGPAIKKSIYEKTFMYSPPAKRVPGKVKPGRPRSVPANICSGSTCKAP